jgi:hypothetical protein
MYIVYRIGSVVPIYTQREITTRTEHSCTVSFVKRFGERERERENSDLTFPHIRCAIYEDCGSVKGDSELQIYTFMEYLQWIFHHSLVRDEKMQKKRDHL